MLKTKIVGTFATVAILLCGLLAGCGMGAKTYGGSGDGTSGIRGRAIGKVYSGFGGYTYAGLEGASIYFYDKEGHEAGWVTTGSRGDYEIGLKPGLYRIIPRDYDSSRSSRVRHPDTTRIIVDPEKEKVPDLTSPKPEAEPVPQAHPVQTAEEQEVVVLSGKFVEVNIDYD
jgi:hypothetical protein